MARATHTLSGTADYTLDLSDCGFLTNAYEGVLKELQTARGGFAYRPYSATIKSAPYLFPLDMIRYKDKTALYMIPLSPTLRLL